MILVPGPPDQDACELLGKPRDRSSLKRGFSLVGTKPHRLSVAPRRASPRRPKAGLRRRLRLMPFLSRMDCVDKQKPRGYAGRGFA